MVKIKVAPQEKNNKVVQSCSRHVINKQIIKSVYDESIFQLAVIYQFRAFSLFPHDSRFWSYSLYFPWQSSRFCVGIVRTEQTSLAKPAYYFWICVFHTFSLPSFFYQLESFFLLSEKQGKNGITESRRTSCDTGALPFVWFRHQLQSSAIFRNPGAWEKHFQLLGQ